MSDEKTQNLTDGRSFEERIYARFDALDARMERMETRLGGLEARMESLEARLDKVDARMDRIEARLDDMDARLQTWETKAYDTKPIWERALAEILELGKKIDRIDHKVDELAVDPLNLRARQSQLEDRMDGLESNRAQ